MTSVTTLRVLLPNDRYATGSLKVFNDKGKIITGPFEVLGKADNENAIDKGNRDRNPLFEGGDTPTGTYTLKVETPQQHFGDSPVIRLFPKSGDALDSYENGRHSLLMHGGPLKPNGDLRPTLGCLRVKNEDLDKLVEVIQKDAHDNESMRCEVKTLELHVEDATVVNPVLLNEYKKDMEAINLGVVRESLDDSEIKDCVPQISDNTPVEKIETLDIDPLDMDMIGRGTPNGD